MESYYVFENYTEKISFFYWEYFLFELIKQIVIDFIES